MTLSELLNSQMDFASLSALARRGVLWWLDELSALLPAAWRARLSSRPRLWVAPGAGGGWRVWRDGQAGLEGQIPDRDLDRVGLLLDPHAVLVREIPVPRMPLADIRRMVALDIDRLSPLSTDLIHFDIDVLNRDVDGGHRAARLGLVPKDRAAALLSHARQAGLAPLAMAAMVDGADYPPRFDFLPQAKAAAGDPPASRARAYWWAGAGALILANLAILVGRDIVETSRLSSVVEAQAPGVEAVLRLRRRVTAEDARRRAMIVAGHRSEPLHLLDVLTQTLPPAAWVERLEWNGQTLRLVGFRREGNDIPAAIRGTGAFTNPRALTGESPAGAAGAAFRPFDITADARADPKVPGGAL